MRYLPAKKQTNFGCLSNCHYCTDRAQNLPGPASDNVLTVLQISSKSVHFGGVIAERVIPFLPVEYFHNSTEAMLRFGRIITRGACVTSASATAELLVISQCQTWCGVMHYVDIVYENSQLTVFKVL